MNNVYSQELTQELTKKASRKLESVEQTYRYLSNTLSTFAATGRLLNNPGIDGADLEAFIDTLRFSKNDFDRNFSINSAMCQFYLDPENGRMTLEDKAEIALSFLPELEIRKARYLELDNDFRENMRKEFGGLVLEEIELQKKGVESNRQLPTSDYDEAAAIAFVDSACV